MKQKPISPAPVELRQQQAVLFAAVAAPGVLLTATGIVSLVYSRFTVGTITGILTVALALWVVVGGFAAWLLVRRSERYTRLQHDFVSNVSHELRTPLTGIRMMVETLRLGRMDPPETRRALELLDAETARLTTLVEEVLEFGRLQSGARNVQLAAHSADDVVDSALREFEAMRLGGEAHVVRDVEPGLFVLGERRALGQVLVNLLSNAFKYGGPEKRIYVRAQRERNRIAISVEDEGPGVAPKLRRRIFRPFVRGDDAETASKPGTGLGLAIAQRLVAAQGGTLRHEPRAGGGSRFVISLRPAPEAPGARREGPTAPGSLPS